jgi:hypothetical protein
MFGRWLVRGAAFVWAALIGPAIGFIAGQRFMGADCQLSPTAGADIEAAVNRAGDAVRVAVASLPLRSLRIPLTQGGLHMPTDPLTLLLWLILAALAALAAALWLRNRSRSGQDPVQVSMADAAPATAGAPANKHWGRDFKIAVGSAGIKSIVREGRMEEAYDVRSASETAFEGYADFDKQQERVALANRLPGPRFLALGDTLDARSQLGDGLGNRPPAEVWAIREEWMPAVSHFVEESAFSLRAAGIWPARITADLSAGGHGVPGLYGLAESAKQFPRADRHAHFIIPEGDVERIETVRLLDALRFGDLAMGMHSEPMPWKMDRLPLALTATLRDNRQGRVDLDEVAAHIRPALNARVRFETGTSENLSNLMRRLTKHGPHADSEPCALTFHYTEAAVPISRDGTNASVDLGTLLPLADSTLRALRYGEGVIRALDVEIARHLLLITVPCNSWDDVRRVEEYVTERLQFAGPPDRRSIGVLFSGYRPDATNREERVFAIALGAVAGGWDAVYRSIRSSHQIVRRASAADRGNGTHPEQELPDNHHAVASRTEDMR